MRAPLPTPSGTCNPPQTTLFTCLPGLLRDQGQWAQQTSSPESHPVCPNVSLSVGCCTIILRGRGDWIIVLSSCNKVGWDVLKHFCSYGLIRELIYIGIGLSKYDLNIIKSSFIPLNVFFLKSFICGTLIAVALCFLCRVILSLLEAYISW